MVCNSPHDIKLCFLQQEKMISQQAHGRHELAVGRTQSNSDDAKRCVDIWLKMPGQGCSPDVK